MLATAGTDGTVRLWNVDSGTEQRFRVHILPEENDAVVTPDGQQVLHASEWAWRCLGWIVRFFPQENRTECSKTRARHHGRRAQWGETRVHHRVHREHRDVPPSSPFVPFVVKPGRWHPPPSPAPACRSQRPPTRGSARRPLTRRGLWMPARNHQVTRLREVSFGFRAAQGLIPSRISFSFLLDR